MMNDFRSAKGLPTSRPPIVVQAGSGALGVAQANNQMYEVPRAGWGICLFDIFTGANPANVWLEDEYGSVQPYPFPLPANSLYSFVATGIRRVWVGGVLASVASIFIWAQETTWEQPAPLVLSDALSSATYATD